ncbi:MAG: hypothetical protein FWD76_04705 [Firmicutes bacterium]|nr:hypothetical protein [Bacillota bacterium]
MKIVKSTQGVESAKSTKQGWLARITKKRWVAVVALSLCFVFCMSFGLQAVFRDKVDPQNVPLEQRALQYSGVIEKIHDSGARLEKQVFRVGLTEIEQDAYAEIVNGQWNKLVKLLETNPEVEQIIGFYESFVESAEQFGWIEIGQAISDRVMVSQTNLVGLRKSEKIGTYGSQDLRGVKWLNAEADKWNTITLNFVALTAVLVVEGVIAAFVPGGQPFAAFIGGLVTVCMFVLNISMGNAKEASKGASNASHILEKGKGYSVYKETGFLGITNGYSVYEV